MNNNTFRLYTSNNLEALAEIYSQKRNANPSRFRSEGFFSKEKICVATRGMGTWLEQWLVKKGHVIANVDFPFLRDAIDDILLRFMNTQKDGDCYRPDLFQENVLIWRLYRLLDNAALDDELKILRDYLTAGNSETATRDVRRYQLARKLAQLYYEYMAFVPEKLVYPEKTDIPKENLWQIVLWNKLCQDNGGTRIISPADAMMRFLHNATVLNGHDFEPVTFFGVSAMAPYFLLVLKKLSTVQPVNFFYLNHCADLWDDARANWEHTLQEPEGFSEHFNNTLLSNFGTQGREFFKAILALDGVDENDHFDYNRVWENKKSYGKFEHGIPLLKDIQTRILENVDNSTETAADCTNDDSLTIHSCFNDLREVESLHDCILLLLKQFKAQNEELTMNDIIVMAPDIAKFAPAIQAVFDRGPLRNHYCISDRSVKGANLLAEAFLKIMEIPLGKFEVTRISSLLDSTPLKARFGFDDDGVARIRDWFRKAGIHWGRDEKDRESIGGFEDFSWQQGLDSLLAKLAFDNNGRDEDSFGGIAPIDYSTGNENQSLLNGLVKLYDELKDFAAAVEQSHTATSPKSGPQWCDLLLEKREKFFLASGETTVEYSQLGKAFTGMKDAMVQAGYAKSTNDGERPSQADIVPYEVILSALSSSMDAPAKGEPFLNGKITFCSLLPMRGIPCKVIAILGMDVGEFPRPNDSTGFTLVTRKDKNGKVIKGNLLKYYDRSRSIEDRFTFLEALMSAKNHLLLFYKGQSDQNLKDDLVPAAPLVELMNYIARIRPNALLPLVKHTLNPFDAKAFSQTKQTNCLLQSFSFNRDMATIAATTADKSAPDKKLPPWLDAYTLPLPEQMPHCWTGDEITITLDDMVSFFKNPAAAYATTRIGLPKNRWEDEPLSDYEPFALNALRASRLKNELAVEMASSNAIATNAKDSSAWNSAAAQNTIPVGGLGDIEFSQQQINSWIMDDDFRNEFRLQEQSAEEDFEIPLGPMAPYISTDLLEKIRTYAKEYSDFDIAVPAFAPKQVRIVAKFKYFHGNYSVPQGLRTRINASLNGKHLIPLIIKHLILAAKTEATTVSKYLLTNQNPKTYEKNEEIAGITTQGNIDSQELDTENLATAKERLKSLAELYIFGHFYPLPFFGKASPQHKTDLKIDLDENDNAARLFTDFNASSSSSENAKVLLQAFAEKCCPKFEKESKKKTTK